MPRMSWPLWRRARTVTRAVGEVKLMYGRGDAMELLWVGTTLVGEEQRREDRVGRCGWELGPTAPADRERPRWRGGEQRQTVPDG